MNKQFFAIKKSNAIVINSVDNAESSANFILQFEIELANLGYMLDSDSVDFLSDHYNSNTAFQLNDALNALRKIKGADVKYTPMYPNFPQQVIDMSEAELYNNAFFHYYTYGEWKPQFETLPRERRIEHVDFTKLKIISDEEFNAVFTKILSSNESISSEDRKCVEWFLSHVDNLTYPEEIPYKENLCVIAGYALNNGLDISKLMKTSTDVLRVITYVSEGDISLSSNTKFKSLSRQKRRILARALEQVASLEDMNRHRGKWVRALHSLHIGEYSKKLYELAKILRSNETIETWNSSVEKAIANGEYYKAISILKQRPSEFARRMDNLIRKSADPLQVIGGFEKVIHDVPTRILIQLHGHFKNRDKENHRVVFPKGTTQKASVITPLEPIDSELVDDICELIATHMARRFSQLEDMGKVWIDSKLFNCPVPTQMRSASASTFSVARGTQLPFGDNNRNTLRFFIYWKGQDIDLSATFHNEEFIVKGHLSYTKLKNSYGHHSGDITRARNGAAEFIDIDIDKCLKDNIRYVAMNVLVFSGPSFQEHEQVYAGWMTRENPSSNELFDPKTVANKWDLTGNARMAIPVVFDVKTRMAIFTDLYTKGRKFSWNSGPIEWLNYGGNNVERNSAKIEQTIHSIVSIPDRKMSIGELVGIHTAGRGVLVTDRDTADFKAGLDDDCDLTPYMVNDINEKLIA